MMKTLLSLATSLALGMLLTSTAQANDHKVMGVIAMPRNETSDLALKMPVCRVVKRIQLTADHGDIDLSGASVYFKTAKSASQSLSVPSSLKEGQTTDWININSDNDNKRCVAKITFSGHTVNSSDMATLKIIGDD
ncbi:protein [Pseudescherichia vulneris]|nr:protein [Pseudescherichia vulneris]